MKYWFLLRGADGSWCSLSINDEGNAESKRSPARRSLTSRRFSCRASRFRPEWRPVAFGGADLQPRSSEHRCGRRGRRQRPSRSPVRCRRGKSPVLRWWERSMSTVMCAFKKKKKNIAPMSPVSSSQVVLPKTTSRGAETPSTSSWAACVSCRWTTSWWTSWWCRRSSWGSSATCRSTCVGSSTGQFPSSPNQFK